MTHVEPVAKIADRASCLCGGRVTFTGDPAAAAEHHRSRRCATRGLFPNGTDCPPE